MKEVKIPLKVEDDKVTADAGDFEVSVTIPKKYQVYMKKYSKLVIALIVAGMFYFGYTIIF